MQDLIQGGYQTWRRSVLAIPLLLVGLCVAGCGTSLFNNTNTSDSEQVSANASDLSDNEQNATLSLLPASGYGGLYVQVSGAHWPGNMMVLVTLEDEQGRSETLAGSDTDSTGNLTTGFIYPIDQRWLASESPWVVTTTADGKVEAKAKFTTVPPGTEVAAASPLATVPAPDTAIAATSTVTTTSVITTQESNYTLALPLVAVAETARSSSGAKLVTIDIAPESVNCRNADEWFAVAILSDAGFDATTIDPGSVDVLGNSGAGLGYYNASQSGSVEFISFHASSKNRASSAQRNANLAYQWRWHFEDVDKNGSTDMFMQFQVGITELTCQAQFVMLTGRTHDGGRFEGSVPVTMLGVEQG